jgi:DNA-nicking Smr family endonuclease
VNPKDEPPAIPEAVEVPIDGTLDLHTFHPRDLGSLIPDYLEACHSRGITSVRLIHGRGTGAVQRSVHALLSRSALVHRFWLGGPRDGGAGATLVELKPTT